MARANGFARRGALIACAALMLSAVACTPQIRQSAVSPRLAPPTIVQAGVLRVGLDPDYPPFAGTADGRQVGIDVDVASAVAGRLGLKPQFVPVPASEIATAIAKGSVDVVMSAPFSADVLSRATIAGTYASDGPALFATAKSPSLDASAPLASLGHAKVGVQTGSQAYWTLVDELGAGSVVAYPTLRQAIIALSQGEVDFAAGDAVVGAYIARDEAGVHYAAPIGPAHLLGIAVGVDNSKLADAVRQTLDSLAADGAIDTIRSTWVGSLPKLPLATSDASGEASGATTTP